MIKNYCILSENLKQIQIFLENINRNEGALGTFACLYLLINSLFFV